LQRLWRKNHFISHSGAYTLSIPSETYADESVLAENRMPDIEKVKPILYATAEKAYFSIGKKIGDAFSMGKRLK
jgi:hypothetical protein